jgi:hypothetical protein
LEKEDNDIDEEMEELENEEDISDDEEFDMDEFDLGEECSDITEDDSNIEIEASDN